MYSIDASVLTNSQMEYEEFHEYSKKLMGIIKDKGITVAYYGKTSRRLSEESPLLVLNGHSDSSKLH